MVQYIRENILYAAIFMDFLYILNYRYITNTITNDIEGEFISRKIIMYKHTYCKWIEISI